MPLGCSDSVVSVPLESVAQRESGGRHDRWLGTNSELQGIRSEAPGRFEVSAIIAKFHKALWNVL